MGGSDGSIIIDTELDQTGFEKALQSWKTVSKASQARLKKSGKSPKTALPLRRSSPVLTKRLKALRTR